MSLLSKLGNYEIEIHGAKVKVSIVENPSFVAFKIEELRSSLQMLQNRVVGLDIKFVETKQTSSIAKFLLLCVGTRCLIIKVLQLDYFPETLRQFLSDETICFLGTGMSNIVQELDSREIGMAIKQPICECPDWNAKVFSHEEIKYAIHNAYTSYVIGNKLLGML
uniref:3'-5' exonuclease domain-containing protein n=1 Tax=Fagus sylvatica TaxID=28930 RepID=A0A2N9H4S3_FAGSY